MPSEGAVSAGLAIAVLLFTALSLRVIELRLFVRMFGCFLFQGFR
jgi:hypothetical protein